MERGYIKRVGKEPRHGGELKDGEAVRGREEWWAGRGDRNRLSHQES